MTDLHDLFEKFEDDSHKFEAVENKLSNRPDIHAFILLDKILPANRDMVSCAEHDQIWLDVDCDELAKVITEEWAQELRRCGVWYDEDVDSLSMFV